jgi:hypothetical protein
VSKPLPSNYDQLTPIEKIEFHFPRLKGGNGYLDTSEDTPVYNCLAWALGINWTRYEPEPKCAGYYWFPGLPRKWDEATITTLFERHGYALADNYDLENGYEKVVFYVAEDGELWHFARQLVSGKWTSKLGDLNDIEHDNLELLTDSDYGNPTIVLKRPLHQDKK